MRDQLLLTESEGGTTEIIPFTPSLPPPLPSLPPPLPSSLRTVFFDWLVIHITLVEYRKHVFKANISLENASGRSVIKINLLFCFFQISLLCVLSELLAYIFNIGNCIQLP